MDSKQTEFVDMEDEEEINYEHTSNSAEDNEFDSIVTCLEEIVQDENFMNMQSTFFEQNCGNTSLPLILFHWFENHVIDVFEDKKENKIIYTEIFEAFSKLIEGFIAQKLSERIPVSNSLFHKL